MKAKSFAVTAFVGAYAALAEPAFAQTDDRLGKVYPLRLVEPAPSEVEGRGFGRDDGRA
jgi:hypothetical protein